MQPTLHVPPAPPRRQPGNRRRARGTSLLHDNLTRVCMDRRGRIQRKCDRDEAAAAQKKHTTEHRHRTSRLCHLLLVALRTIIIFFPIVVFAFVCRTVHDDRPLASRQVSLSPTSRCQRCTAQSADSDARSRSRSQSLGGQSPGRYAEEDGTEPRRAHPEKRRGSSRDVIRTSRPRLVYSKHRSPWSDPRPKVVRLPKARCLQGQHREAPVSLDHT